MALHDPSKIFEERIHLEGTGLRLTTLGGILGVAALIVAFIMAQFMGEHGNKEFYFSYLISYTYFLSLSLGCLMFTALQHLTRAGWSVVVRRMSEIFAANIPLLVILFLPILFGMGHLYIWTNSDAVAASHLLQLKSPYLNIPFFIVRCLIYFSVWWFFSRSYLARSLEQDQSGLVDKTHSMERISPLAILLTAITLTFAAFDFIMTLSPAWFSTIFGVYYFAGSMLGCISILILSSYFLQKNGRLTNAITTEHYHDLGKLLFGFIFFWGYIAFSQYMLIWYGNIPEETEWFLLRQTGQWLSFSMFLIFFHFVIPFIILLSRIPKRNKSILVWFAVWMLVMHYVDLFWMIKPVYGHAIHEDGVIHFGMVDILCFVGMLGLFIAGSAKLARGHALVPVKDPRLAESLRFENF